MPAVRNASKRKASALAEKTTTSSDSAPSECSSGVKAHATSSVKAAKAPTVAEANANALDDLEDQILLCHEEITKHRRCLKAHRCNPWIERQLCLTRIKTVRTQKADESLRADIAEVQNIFDSMKFEQLNADPQIVQDFMKEVLDNLDNLKKAHSPLIHGLSTCRAYHDDEFSFGFRWPRGGMDPIEEYKVFQFACAPAPSESDTHIEHFHRLNNKKKPRTSKTQVGKSRVRLALLKEELEEMEALKWYHAWDHTDSAEEMLKHWTEKSKEAEEDFKIAEEVIENLRMKMREVTMFLSKIGSRTSKSSDS